MCFKIDCSKCSKPTKNKECIHDHGKPLCPDCYCDSCLKPLNPNEGKPAPNGKKLCPACANSGNKGNECPVCSKPITPSSSPPPVSCCGQTYHKPCFKCNNCSKPLTPGDDSVKVAPGSKKPYCGPCSSKQFCPTCGDDLANGQPVVQAGPQKYHQPCFRCTACNKPFGAGKYVNSGGRPYCPGCKPSQNIGSCAKCHQPLTPNNAIEALDKPWHPQCFTCTTCNSPFPSGDYVEIDNLPYCHNCANGVPDHCVECRKPLSGQVAEINGNFWHYGCFKCSRCQKALEKAYTPFQDYPYCKDCYHVVAASEVCYKCKGVLEGQCIKIRDKPFHEGCFGCSKCGCHLNSSSPGVHVKFSSPYCDKCWATVKPPTPDQQPAPITTISYGIRQQGFTVDPRSGKKTFH